MKKIEYECVKGKVDVLGMLKALSNEEIVEIYEYVKNTVDKYKISKNIENMFNKKD